MNQIYDSEAFFDQYAKMSRSQQGLPGAGEWHQLRPLFPDLNGKRVLDLGCGYGWHCKYAVERGAESVLGIDSSEKMIAEAKGFSIEAVEEAMPDPAMLNLPGMRDEMRRPMMLLVKGRKG